MRWFLALAVVTGPIMAQDEVEAPVPEAVPEAPAEEAPPPAPVQPATPIRRSTPSSRTGAAATQPAAVMPAVPGPGRAGTVGVIDFQGTPLQAVLEYYAQNLARRSLIQAPSLPATPIYFRSQSDLTIEEAKAALESVLAINSIALIPLGEKFLKVVQIQTAKQEGLPFIGEGKAQTAADALMTQVIPLQYAEPGDVAQALQPYLHAYGNLLPLPKSSCLLITETAANVNQMLEIVKYIDVPSALKMETRIFVLRHAKAGDVVARLQGIIQETQQLGARAATPTPTPVVPTPAVRPAPGGARPGTTASAAPDDSVIEGKVIITSDERTNKLFILSRASNFTFFEKVIEELDAKVEPDVIMKVVSLQYATAEDAASAINALISGGSPTYTRRTTTATGTSGARTTTPPPPPVAAGTSGAGGDTGFLQFAQGVRVLPDPRTNSLLVMATKEDMARLEELIKSIDTAVAQVQIEVVIAEVTLDSGLNVGVNVFKRLFDAGQTSQTGGTSTDGNAPVQLPRSTDFGNDLMEELPTAAGLASGAGGLTYFTTFRNLKLDAVIHVLAKSSRAKVLSTPVIQTMDNQEANILVGESRPVPVSTVSSVVGNTGTLSTGSLNSNIEFKDIAIELKVTPRINPDGYVRMDIEQKVNDVGGTILFNGADVPIITKREARSSVAVQDQSTIVLGGLIKENKVVSETKVPFLGDIPFFGLLFKSKNNTKIRNELIIFVRPTVLRTDAAAVAEAKRRSRLLRAADELELDKQFRSNEAPTDTQAPDEPAAATPDDPLEDRYTAKRRALEEQIAKPEDN